MVDSGRLELAAETCDSPHLEAVATAHDRMDRFIGDLLTYARMGAATLSITEVDVGDLAEGCCESTGPSDATLEVVGECTIQADRERLRQLIEILLQNAVDHAEADTTVTVGMLAGGFYVADDGPGIPETDREDVFEAGLTTATDGTGFGLTIVDQIATAHDWTITVTKVTSPESTTGINSPVVSVDLAL